MCSQYKPMPVFPLYEGRQNRIFQNLVQAKTSPFNTPLTTSPFNKGGLRGIFCYVKGRLGKMYQLFGEDMEDLIEELNGGLVA